MMQQITPVLKYPGSKWNVADWIISHMPEHEAYLEPFFGGGAIFFSKEPVGYETINDINSDVTNLFKIIRDYPAELAYLVNFTPYSRQEFDLSWTDSEGLSEIEKARLFLIKCWQGFGGRLSSKPGWACEIQPGAKRNSIVNRWNRVPKAISSIVERLKNAQIENMDAIKLIKRYRFKDVLIYADPPYCLETRTGGKYYKNEMSSEKHIELLEVLNEHPGPVLLSGYESQLYDDHLKGWSKKLLKATTEKGQVRTEVLWVNQVTVRKLEIESVQLDLFEEAIS